MIILSIDCGIKNLAYCLFDVLDEKKVVIEWDVMSIHPQGVEKPNIHQLSDVLFDCLKRTFHQHRIDTILIENQPCMKNPTMKSVQIMIYSFFKLEKSVHNIHFTGASRKLLIKELPKIADIQLTPKASYAEKKKCAILYTKAFLEMQSDHSLKVGTELVDMFNKSKKKDDLSDAFLQCISWLENK